MKAQDQWWKKAALGAGAVGALLLGGLFGCGSTFDVATAEARPIKVSAQKSCRWRHKTVYRDNLDRKYSYTAGRAGCYAPVSASCLSIINVGSDYADDIGSGSYGCYSKAKVTTFRPTAYNYGSSFAFSLVLPEGYVWSKGFKSGETPNQGCSGLKTRTLACIDIHDSGIYLAGPSR